MQKRSWILFVICLVVFIALRLLSVKREPQEACEKVKPLVPEPILVNHELLSHPWLLMQPKVTSVNIEMVRDLAALDELCKEIVQQRSDWSQEQIEMALIKTLSTLQMQIPFELPNDLYSVLCISETPSEWIKPPVPFHVYKRLYLGEMESGLPFYLDVRVFELEGATNDDVIAWHLGILDGEPNVLYRSEKRAIYTSMGERTHETAHGFAKGQRGLFIDSLERDGRLYVLYAEAPFTAFKKYEYLFKQLEERDYAE